MNLNLFKKLVMDPVCPGRNLSTSLPIVCSKNGERYICWFNFYMSSNKQDITCMSIPFVHFIRADKVCSYEVENESEVDFKQYVISFSTELEVEIGVGEAADFGRISKEIDSYSEWINAISDVCNLDEDSVVEDPDRLSVEDYTKLVEDYLQLLLESDKEFEDDPISIIHDSIVNESSKQFLSHIEAECILEIYEYIIDLIAGGSFGI